MFVWKGNHCGPSCCVLFSNLMLSGLLTKTSAFPSMMSYCFSLALTAHFPPLLLPASLLTFGVVFATTENKELSLYVFPASCCLLELCSLTRIAMTAPVCMWSREDAVSYCHEENQENKHYPLCSIKNVRTNKVGMDKKKCVPWPLSLLKCPIPRPLASPAPVDHIDTGKQIRL